LPKVRLHGESHLSDADLLAPDPNGTLMKRTILAGSFYLLAGAATLLLAASIFYSCRSGGDPHHSGTAGVPETAPMETTQTELPPQATTERMPLTLARAPSSELPPAATE